MPKYFLSNSERSSERLALLKLEEILNVLKQLLDKLDSDGGVSDIDYAALAASVTSIATELRININTAS